MRKCDFIFFFWNIYSRKKKAIHLQWLKLSVLLATALQNYKYVTEYK